MENDGSRLILTGSSATPGYTLYETNPIVDIATMENNLTTVKHVDAKTISLQAIDISYEDLVENPKSSTKKMLAFCELPWENRCLEFYNTARQVTTASDSQVRQPIYKTAVKRWQRFERLS